jgi:hypothetical protein
MAKKRKSPLIGQCIYCGQIAERHDDHIPPKCLFSEPRPPTLITVPCCGKCIKRFEKDDEYFKTVITLTLSARKKPQFRQIIDRSVRALGRKEADAFRALVLNNA